MSRREPVPARQHLDDMQQRLAQVSTDVEAMGKGLTPTQLRWRPDPRSWSIAHCLEHLINTTKAYESPVLVGIENSGRAPAPKGGGTYSPGWFGRWFIASVGPDGKRRFKAPAAFQPAPEVPGRVRERFATSQEHLSRLILEAHDVDLDRSRVKLPTVPLLKISVGEALEVLIEHQRRHVAQARRVREHEAFPVSVFEA